MQMIGSSRRVLNMEVEKTDEEDKKMEEPCFCKNDALAIFWDETVKTYYESLSDIDKHDVQNP